MPDLSQFTAEFFKALAHPMRVRILDTLRSGEVGVNELSARLKAEQSTLSQQLAILRKSSIVVGRKEGQNVSYSVPHQAIFRLLDDSRQVFNNHLVDIRDLLSQLTPAGEKGAAHSTLVPARCPHAWNPALLRVELVVGRTYVCPNDASGLQFVPRGNAIGPRSHSDLPSVDKGTRPSSHTTNGIVSGRDCRGSGWVLRWAKVRR